MPNTTALTVTFTLYSSDPNPPYDVSGCAGTITYSDGTDDQFQGWNAQNLGTPQPNGASFTLMVADANYSSGNNQTSVATWALTFIPRSGTSQQSPFGNNVNTITGNGATNNNGVFTLNLGNVKIK